MSKDKRKPEETGYTKRQWLRALPEQADMINALFEEDKLYTEKEAEDILSAFLDKEVH